MMVKRTRQLLISPLPNSSSTVPSPLLVPPFSASTFRNFYLITPFDHPSHQYEYHYIPEWAIPKDVMQEYNLRPLIKNKQLLDEVRTGMYGLPQAGRLAYIKLIKHLADDAYVPTGDPPGLFHHITRPAK
jgi:hypothetical protein